MKNVYLSMSHFSLLLCLFLSMLSTGAIAQGFQKAFPNTFLESYEVEEFANGNIQMKIGSFESFTQVGSFIVNPDGDFISFSTPFTRCTPPTATAFYGPRSISSFTIATLATDNVINVVGTEAGPQCISPPALTPLASFSFPPAQNITVNSILTDEKEPVYFTAGRRALTDFPFFENEIWVVKTDDAGNELWRYEALPKTFATASGPGVSVRTGTSDGGCIFTTDQVSFGNSFINKLDGNGELVFEANAGTPLTLLQEVREHPNGNTLVRKFTAGNSGPTDNPSLEIFSPTGASITILRPSVFVRDYLNLNFIYGLKLDAIEILDNGNIIGAGTNSGLVGPAGLYLFQTDPQGNIDWIQFYDFGIPMVSDITQAANGDLLFTGALEDELWLMRTDAAGNLGTPICNNIMLNPGFENGAANWTASGTTQLSTEAYTGSQAVEMCEGSGTLTQAFPAQEGETYRAAFAGKVTGRNADTGAFAFVELRFLDNAYAPLPDGPTTGSFTAVEITTSNYQEFEIFNQAPVGTAFVQVHAVKNGDYCVFFDDFELCAGVSIPASDLAIFCPGNWPVVQAAPGATGANVSWPGGFSGRNSCSGTGTFEQVAGPDNGGFFPIGETDVCYEYSNACGDVDSCCFIVTVEGDGGGGDIDLELTLDQPNANPSQWNTYAVTATLENKGGQKATGVSVSFPKPAGVVYTGGNEYTASQGSFSPNGNESWTVGDIPPGSSATLTVNYFLLISTAPVAYAQVSAANESDVDSTPGNGTCCVANEDDEASSDGINLCATFTCSQPFWVGNEACPGNPISFAVMSSVGGGSGNYTYTWSDGQTGNIANNLEPGTYTVTVEDVDFGCSCVGSVTGTDYPIPFSVDLTVLQNASSASASDGEIRAELTSLSPLSPYTYRWSDGSTVQSNNVVETLSDLAAGNYSVTVTSSVFSCENTAEVILPADGGGDIDLSMSLSADPIDPPIYSITSLSLSVSNTGPQMATGVKIAFPRPAGTVYTGGNEYTASQGNFTPNGSEEWTVGDLAAGSTAILTVNYFTLTADPLEAYAQVIAANETDGDSSPGNGICCTAIEDDEAAITLGGTINRQGADTETGALSYLPVQLKKLYPNPTDRILSVGILSQVEGTFDLLCYDLYGQLVKTEKVSLEQGWNAVDLEVSGLSSGNYLLLVSGMNRPGVPKRFVVVRD